MFYTTQQAPKGRGCGDRKDGEPYLCTGSGPGGKPVDHFIIDPAMPWADGWQRGYRLQVREDGIYDVIVFVGKSTYPSPWMFVEEARNFGISRRVAKNFPFEKLTPGQSRMLYCHIRAIPTFEYELHPWMRQHHRLTACKFESKQDSPPWNETTCGFHPDQAPCTFALRDLSILVAPQFVVEIPVPLHLAGKEPVHMTLPSYSYLAQRPIFPRDSKGMTWQTGIFMWSRITHIEIPKKADQKTVDKVKKAGYDLAVTNW